MEVTSDIEPYLEFCLEMEYAASRPYTKFVYDDPADAKTAQRFLAERGLTEFSPPYGRVLLDKGEPIGLVTGHPGAELRAQRMKAAFALAKANFFPSDSLIPKRIHLASQALMVPTDDEFYSGRLGIRRDIQNAGLGVTLMGKIVEEAYQRGFNRVVGEVHPAVKNMLRLCCDHLGFREIGQRRVEDPDTKRVLEYVQIAVEKES